MTIPFFMLKKGVITYMKDILLEENLTHNKDDNTKEVPLTTQDLDSFPNTIKNIRSIIMTIAAALIAVCILNQFCFILSVPSSSMEPTMNPNEKFFATKIIGEDLDYGIYGFYFEELEMRLVKRLIGKPGYVIEFKDDKLIRNGKEIEEDYILYEAYFTGTYEVPDEKYFFLGDNRANSIDARFWKNPYIDRDDIIGKVIFRVHPYFRIGFIK